MKLKKTKIFFGSLAAGLFLPLFCRAAGFLDAVTNQCKEKGDCTLNDIMSVVIKAANWIWGISGSLALLFFIYGGFTFLISAGETDKVNKAKEIIKNSLIGLIVIFVSYTIVSFVVYKVLGVKGDWSIVGGIM